MEKQLQIDAEEAKNLGDVSRMRELRRRLVMVQLAIEKGRGDDCQGNGDVHSRVQG